LLIDNNNKSVNIVSSLQEGIVKYLLAVQFASWNILKRNIVNLYITFFGEELSPFSGIEYKVIYPLLKSGVIEVARRPQSDKLVYCLGPDLFIETENNLRIEIIPCKNICRIIEVAGLVEPTKSCKVIQGNPLAILASIPSMHSIVTHWEESKTEMQYIYDRFNSDNHFLSATDTSIPNIYTRTDRVYSNRYIRIEKSGILYRIPAIEDNIDGLNIAYNYLMIIRGRPLFIFDYDKRELTCKDFSNLPFLLCRALILCDPTILEDGRVNKGGSIKVNNITSKHVLELKRIFGNKSVEAKNE